MKKKKPATKKGTSAIRNRRASFDYTLGDSFLVGIVLSGGETKALRMGHGHLRGAYATVKNDELWLVNATITGAPGINLSEDEQVRDRKLLAKRRELDTMVAAKKQGLTIVPTELLTKTRYIKLRISLGRGKKHYDKREVIKRRDTERANRREIS